MPRSIKWKLILGVALVHAVLMTVFIFDLVERQKTFLLNQVEQQTEAIAKTLASNASEWVLSNNVSGLQEIIELQSRYPNLDDAFIHNNEGQVLAHTDASMVGRYVSDEKSLALLKHKSPEQWMHKSKQNVHYASEVVTRDGTRIGWVRVSVNSKIILENLAYLSKEGAVYTVFAIVIGSVFAWVLGHRLTLNICSVLYATRQVDPTRSKVLFERIPNDEVGHLMTNFNEMQSNLFAYDQANRTHIEDIQFQALHDPLTGIENRRAFEQKMLQLRDEPLLEFTSVILIDLDDFKILNDIYGHELGDLLLIHVAQRLAEITDADHALMRLGGDEFVIIYEHLGKHYEYAEVLARQFVHEVLAVLSTEFYLSHMPYHTTASIGYSLIKPQQPLDLKTSHPLKRADIALYKSKSKGKGCATLFSLALQEKLDYENYLSDALEDAVRQQELTWLIQPQYDMSTGRVIGGEVLCRWCLDAQWISPDVFISVAEKTSLISELTKQQFKSVVELLDEADCHRTKISINLSPTLIFDDDLIDFFMETAHVNHVEVSQIKIEITEGVFIEHTDRALQFFRKIKEQGFSISLDDFGTGYSSLSYINTLPIDEIKIDKSFVEEMDSNKTTESIVKTIIDLTENIGVEVLAEGVEVESQKQFLLNHGCHLCQGYLYSPPVSLDEFVKQEKETNQRLAVH